MRDSALTITLLALSALVLATRSIGGTALTHVTAFAFVLFCLVGLPSATIRERFLFLASLALTTLLVMQGKAALILPEALNLAAYFAAFIALLTGLKIAAERSDSVLTVGRYLIRQPASRRFVATAGGGHILGVFLNFAAVSLMAPLIQNAAKRENSTTDPALEQRQLTALLRGFAWILLWAPTTLSQAVLLTLFTDIDLPRLILIGLTTSFLLTGLGFVLDRFEWRNMAAFGTAPPLPKAAMLRLSLVCIALIAATGAIQITFGITTALALMFVAPTVTVFWFIAQRKQSQTLPKQIAAFWPALNVDIPELTRAAIALGLSGFIGRTLAETLPMAALAQNLNLTNTPGWLFLAALPVLITLGGQIALSPIILVVFIGQVVQTIPALPADPTHIVFALSAGWAISMFASPNATATLLISATTKIPPTRLTWGWNLRYSALCYLALVLIFAVIET